MNTGRLVLKKLFSCVGEYTEYGFDQQRLIWYVCRLWDMVGWMDGRTDGWMDRIDR